MSTSQTIGWSVAALVAAAVVGPRVGMVNFTLAAVGTGAAAMLIKKATTVPSHPVEKKTDQLIPPGTAQSLLLPQTDDDKTKKKVTAGKKNTKGGAVDQPGVPESNSVTETPEQLTETEPDEIEFSDDEPSQRKQKAKKKKQPPKKKPAEKPKSSIKQTKATPETVPVKLAPPPVQLIQEDDDEGWQPVKSRRNRKNHNKISPTSTDTTQPAASESELPAPEQDKQEKTLQSKQIPEQKGQELKGSTEKTENLNIDSGDFDNEDAFPKEDVLKKKNKKKKKSSDFTSSANVSSSVQSIPSDTGFSGDAPANAVFEEDKSEEWTLVGRRKNRRS